MPIPDPDTTVTPDTLWDEMIPKDTAVGSGVLDMDTQTADTTPEFELGELDVTDFAEVGMRPVEMFNRRKMVSFASAPIGFHLDPETPFTDMFYIPTDFYKARSRKGAFIQYPSYMMMAVSQPDYAATTNTWPALQSTAEWMQMRYISETLMDMWKSLTALVTSGTQESAFEAAVLIEQFFEHFHEAQGNAWGGASPGVWRTFNRVTVDITLEGTYKPVSIGSSL